MNYKWVVHTNNNINLSKIDQYLVTLTDENFQSTRDFEQVSDIDDLIDRDLSDYGLESDWTGQHGCKIRFSMWYEPDETLVEITAPLYNLRHNLLMETYTSTITVSSLPDILMRTYEECKSEVYGKMAKKFQGLYDKNTLDGGLSSPIVVSEKLDSFDSKVFFAKYVPTGFIKVAETCFSRDRLRRKRTLFMKKEDYQGKNITIFVPPILAGAAIGWKGENIKKVAEKLNASYIDVQKKLN